MNNIIYLTYDINLKKFLSDHGVKDIIYGMNPNTNKLFWVYERNEILNQLLNLWYK